MGATREEDLAALRTRIESMRAELEGRESDRREAREALRASEVAISAASRELLAREAEAREAREAIGELAARRSAQERALASQQAALGRLLAARAIARLAGDAPDFVRVALSGEDLADAARRLHYLAYVSREAARVLDAHRKGLAELAALKQGSEAKAAELAGIEARSRTEREQLLKERRERRRVLERIAGEMRDAKKRMQALVADANRLSRLIEEIGKVLQARPGAGFRRGPAASRGTAEVPADAQSTPFSALKGRLRTPVRGELIGRYGAQQAGLAGYGKGIFIRTAESERVRAVAPGRVVYADWMRGFGNLMIVDHGEGFLSIYGNNESLLKQTGDPVTLGEPLAVAGQSGGNEQTGLYFELRHLGKPFDPIGWVNFK